MITGDAALTACAVARRVGICNRPKDRMLVLSPVKNTTDEVEWVIAANKHRAPRPGLLKRLDFVATKESVMSLSTEYDLCVTGAALERIAASGCGAADSDGIEKENKRLLSVLCAIAPSVVVFAVSLLVTACLPRCLILTLFLTPFFANSPSLSPFSLFSLYFRSPSLQKRVAPTQKEAIVTALHAAGLSTLMCGDGTNDVGALRAAGVGVSVVSDAAVERAYDKAQRRVASSTHTAGSEALDKALDEALGSSGTTLKLGDASLAAPFTAKRPSVNSCADIVRQGRKALATAVQMYKIL